MSKQSEAKEAQGYVARPVQPTCTNCANFKFDHVQIFGPSFGNPDGFFEDKNLRCGLGEFKVMKTATCKEYTRKPQVEAA